MADPHASHNLGYGTPGTAIYNSELQDWTFLRSLAPSNQYENEDLAAERRPLLLNPIEQAFSTVVPPVLQSDHLSASSSLKPTRSLRRALPELAFVPSQLEIKNHYPGAAKSTSRRNFDLLAFGNAYHTAEANSIERSQLTPIVAHAYGEAGEVLRIARLIRKKSKLQRHSSKSEDVCLPTISSQDVALCMGSGAPILQICSDQSTNSAGTWLAVRFATATIFYAPCVHPHAVRARSASASNDHIIFPPSTLDANPVVSLPISRTGGSSHVDIDFHPAKKSQVAIVDDLGTWSVWQLRHPSQEAGNLERIGLLISGKLSAEESQQEPSQSCPWYCVRWLDVGHNGHDRVLVCSRRKVGLFDVRGHVLSVAEIDLGLPQEHQCIIDVRRLQHSIGQCFILTNFRIIWLASHVPSWLAQDRPVKDLEMVLSWRHFLNTENVSLYMNVMGSNSETILVVSSTLNPLSLVFRFGKLEEMSSSLSTEDPALFLTRLPTQNPEMNVLDVDTPGRAYFILIKCHYENEKASSQDFGVLKVFIVRNDLSIHEHAFQTTIRNPLTSKSLSFSREGLPSNEGHNMVEKSAGYEKAEDFLVEHDEESKFQNSVHFDRLTYMTDSEDLVRQAHATWYLNHEDIYQIAAGIELQSPLMSPETDESMTLSEVLEKIKHRIRSSDRTQRLFVRLLGELSESSPVSREVEEESRKLSQLLLLYQGDVAQNIILSATGTRYPRNFSTLSETYDELIRLFVTSLPPETPGRLRVSKERVCRAMAADIMLANHSLRERHGAFDNPNSETFNDQSASAPAGSSFPPQASFNQTEGLSKPLTATDSAIRRLRAFSPVTEFTPAAGEKTISRLLAHIDPSPEASPKKHSYLDMDSGVNASIDTEKASSMNLKERRKAESRREKLERKRQKAEIKVVESSQRVPPTIASSQVQTQQDIPLEYEQDRREQSSQTQPTAALARQDEGSSSVLPVVQSQPVHGAFGTRARTGKAGLIGKRKAGF